MLPEIGVVGMQELGGREERLRETAGASPTIEDGTVTVKPEPPGSPPPWTPEDFLQSTLHEGSGAVITTAPRARRKQQWKLKFHHQALPPEYLDHYEASLNKSAMAQQPPAQKAGSNNTNINSNQLAKIVNQTGLHNGIEALENLPNESIQTWLQRITNLQNEMQKTNSSPATPIAAAPVKRKRSQNQPQHSNQSSKILNYRDLPYMGEMTLNNSKPRRGRKPKKADICHLIYKNYGTIFPGTPSHLVDERLNPGGTLFDKNVQHIKQERESVVTAPNKQRTDLQNKIISSLLEKRLSLENKRNRDFKAKKSSSKCIQVNEEEVFNKSVVIPDSSAITDSEPLNLCVRDLNNLKIRLLRKHGNVYAKANVETKLEPGVSTGEVMSPLEKLSEPVPGTSSEPLSPTPRMNFPDFKKVLQEATSSSESNLSVLSKPELGSESPLPGGYVYWPNAGAFVHPLALQSHLLYYQGLAAGNSYSLPPEQQSPSIDSPTSSRTPISPSILGDPQPSPGGSSCSSTPSISGSKSKRATPQGNTSNANPTKRKRSAIFIPPMPSETSSSPATEVSICKFKFTGGARPSLQEKKMLSVDAGGNFRYYSGTGDKANRGYEFFPRESMQQPSMSPINLNSSAPLSLPSASPLPQPVPQSNDPIRRKRKSRKSLQREKLEQTFKEKGFLIQTQQLESAEGATYCKFRQLRKFTRYLFRSWKDYLPGAVGVDGETSGAMALPPAPEILPLTAPPQNSSAEWP